MIVTSFIVAVCCCASEIVALGNDTTTQAPACPELSDPDNGQVTLLEGSASYSCFEGFELVGNATRLCEGDSWSGVVPRCQIITTAAPTTPSAVGNTQTGGSTVAPAADVSTASMGETMPATTKTKDGDKHDMDNHTDKDGEKHDMDTDNGKDGEKGSGGLSDGQIALTCLATFLIVGAVATFLGLMYWKYKGSSYVTVNTDTTFSHA